MKNKTLTIILAAIILAAGTIALGLCIRSGLNRFAERTRTVDVRGLAEREVKANLVTWPIVTKQQGNDLPSLYNKGKNDTDAVVNFLKQNGVKDNEISIAAPVINDRWTYEQKGDHYSMTSVVTVTSHNIDNISALIKRQGELIQKGIFIEADNYSNQISYEFTDLNTIKPEMIAEATRNARQAAQQFADDSQCSVGKIMTATQGQFSIEDRDSYTPQIKNVRVVTYVTYSLQD